jgi:hypothetical protein
MKKLFLFIIVFTVSLQAQTYWGWKATQDSINKISLQITSGSASAGISDSTVFIYKTDSSTIFMTPYGLDTAKGNIRTLIGTKQNTITNLGDTSLYFKTADTSAFNSKALTNAQLAYKQNLISNIGDTSKYYKTVDTNAFNSKTLTTAQLGLKLGKVDSTIYVTPYYLSTHASWGGGVGNADSLGRVPAASYALYSDTTIRRAYSNALYQTKGSYLIASDSTANRTFGDLKYQAKGTYLIPSDSTRNRAYSALLYQAKGTYLVPADSTANRTFSNLKYQVTGTYLVPSDSTANRTFSNLKYQAKATYLIPSDSTSNRAYSNFLYFYKSSDTGGTATITAGDSMLTVSHYLGVTPSNIQLTPQTNLSGINYWIDAVGTSTFRIRLCLPAIDNCSFYWRAKK